MDECLSEDVSLDPAASTLVSGPNGSRCRRGLLDVLDEIDSGAGVLLVATSDATGAVAELRQCGVAPDAIGVVDASDGGSTPSGTAESDTVAGPGSLSALGVAASDLLERLSHRFDRVFVGVDSTTDVLEAAPLPATFRFLHVLGGRVQTADATLIATVDRSVHDEETLRTIAELFDEILVVD